MKAGLEGRRCSITGAVLPMGTLAALPEPEAFLGDAHSRLGTLRNPGVHTQYWKGKGEEATSL